MSKKVSVFGREVSVFLIVMLGVMGIASAALIPYFAEITGLVTVNQGLQVGGQDWDYAFSYSDTLTSLEEKTVSSPDYSLINSATVNANVVFDNVCDEASDDGCENTITTDMVLLSVTGFEGTDPDAFARQFYKATDYESPVSNLNDLSDLTYQFEITQNDFGVTNLAPYVVIVGTGIGPYDVAVQMIPDGGIYNTGTEYEKDLTGATFHVPGDGECTQATPCTFERIKEKWPSVTLSKIRLALGAWPGTHSQVISASMGISTINDLQAVHKMLIVGAGETSSLKVVTYFPQMMKPDTYTITTTVLPTA
ncbi:MAG: hypothetical protein KKF68_02855 [Nanoarchaeota archaeon]|nr:hypothetical protein [Nanoarchaeota archaeon]